MSYNEKSNEEYGRTITIKYYVNTKLKSSSLVHKANGITSYTLPLKYPLYILINVKRQPTQFKSMFSTDLSTDELEPFLQRHSKDVEYEKQLITKSILAHKPFENQQFNVNDAVKDYKSISRDFGEILDDYLEINLYKALEKAAFETVNEDLMGLSPRKLNFNWPKEEIGENGRTAEYNGRFRNFFENGPFAIGSDYSVGFWINILRKPNDKNDPVQKLYEKFGSEVWYIKDFCKYICVNENRKIVRIEDWNNRSFDKSFMDLYKDVDKLFKLVNGIQDIIDNEPDLKRLILIAR